MHGAFASVLGEADWVLRLPDLLAALACVALLVSIVLRMHGPRVAVIAGVGLALCSEYFRRISQFRLDIPHAALDAAGGADDHRGRHALDATSDVSRPARARQDAARG